MGPPSRAFFLASDLGDATSAELRRSATPSVTIGAAGHAYTAPMKIAPLAALLLSALLSALLTTGVHAQSVNRAQAHAALSPVEGEVIVGFKTEASTLRKHALAAHGDAASVRKTLDDRATALGTRRGRALISGVAVGERAQVVRATGMDAATLAQLLAADPEVAYAQPNGRMRRLTTPNDPLYAATARGVRTLGPDSGQWYLRAPTAAVVSAIDIEAAWARTLGSASVVVAVLDTGVRFEHPDLGRAANGGQLLPGYDMVSDAVVANDSDGRDADPSDPGDWVTSAESNTTKFSGCKVSSSSWHGTSTASLVAAATGNATGMAGTAPGVRVLPVRVLGKCFGVNSDILAGMRWAAGIAVAGAPANPNPAKVINMSLGGTGACSAAYQAAVDEIVARGVVIVAAAGNTAGGPVSEPANCRGVIAVTALRHVGSKVGFSDLGPEISIAAPGGNCVNLSGACLYPILAATNSGLTAPVNSDWTNSFDITVGTSFSSPLVAGVAALMMSQRPGLTPDQLRTAMQASARPFPTTGADNGSDPTPVAQCRTPSTSIEQLQCYCVTGLCGAGMLDAGAAVAAVAGALARIDIATPVPTAGFDLQFSGAASLAAPGATGLQYAWSLVGGVATGFSSSTNAATATLMPTGAGDVTVRLTVTDSLGQTNSVNRTVSVAAAPVTPAPASSGGGGGGGSSGAWVAGVALAAGVLRALRRRT